MQHDAAYNTGVLLGRLFAIIVPLIFLALAAMALGDRRANKKCLLSLIFFLGGFLLATLPQFLPVSSARTILSYVADGILFICMVTSVVLAVLGLIEYRERHSSKGRASAIVALTLNGLMLLLLGVAFIVGFTVALSRGAAARAPQPPFVSTDLNFQFSVPSPWVRVQTPPAGSSAALSLARANPRMYFVIIAARPGIDRARDTESTVANVKAHVQTTASTLSYWQQTSTPLHDMDGVRVDFDARSQGQSLAEVQWICSYHGFIYQLMAWTTEDNRAELMADAMPLFENFQLIDPSLEAHDEPTPAQSSIRDYHSVTNGFGMKLAGTIWTMPIPRLFEVAPHAELGVEDPEGDAFVVIPLASAGTIPTSTC